MASNYEGKRLNSFNCHILIEQKLTYNTCEISSTASLTFKRHFTKVWHEGPWHVMRKVNMWRVLIGLYISLAVPIML